MNLAVRQFIARGRGIIAFRFVFLRPFPGLPGDDRLLIIGREGVHVFHPGEMIFPETVDHVVLVNPGPRHFHALVGQAAGPGSLYRLRIFYGRTGRTVFGVVEVHRRSVNDGMRQGRVSVFRVFGQVRDAIAVASGGFRDNRHAGRHEVGPGDQGYIHGLNRRRRLQWQVDRRQGVIVRDDQLGTRAAVVVVRGHAGRPAADGLKKASQRIA